MTSAQAPAPSACATLSAGIAITRATENRWKAQANTRPHRMTISPAGCARKNYAPRGSARNARGGLVVAGRGGEHGLPTLLPDSLAVEDVKTARRHDAGAADQHRR